MKDHIKEERTVSLYDLEGDPREVHTKLMAYLPEVFVEPNLEVAHHYYDEGSEFTISWWRPMTEKELEKASARRKAERAAKKALKEKKEAEERAEYERLKEKYGT